ncbi:Retinal dehydrogenase 1 [Eumeta japonica]|uniref:Retinal dehydrogenase 1 n=1 Tax=Eumeta variegata TaxID=151549 RepID=A0A4C1UC07_EUMVA|nr:Retinal dehydrogenase 1 [Eumeta japonica]
MRSHDDNVGVYEEAGAPIASRTTPRQRTPPTCPRRRRSSTLSTYDISKQDDTVPRTFHTHFPPDHSPSIVYPISSQGSCNAVVTPLVLFIDNEWVDAESGKTFETVSPIDGKVITRVAEGDKYLVSQDRPGKHSDFEIGRGSKIGVEIRARIRTDNDIGIGIQSGTRINIGLKTGTWIGIEGVTETDMERRTEVGIENRADIDTVTDREADIEKAVAAARRAFHRKSEWRQLTASARGRLLHRFADLIERDAEYLSTLETTDNGMLYAMSRLMMQGIAGTVRYAAGLADKVHGDTIPSDFEGFTYTLRQPVGVCGLILPWNGPMSMFVSKVATALAAGCTMVVKPAEQTPLTALALAALLAEAGVPRGVVNVVNGYGPTAGAALTHHPHVAKVSFTGSLEVGKIIQQAAGASNLKRVTLELGGKSPLVICDDADLNVAVPYAAEGVFAHQGQVCVAASRLFVQSKIYDEFVKRAVEYAKNRKVGNPFTEGNQNGPQVDEEMMNKVLGYIEKGKAEGAKLLTGGQRIGTTGYYLEPTVFADVTDNMTIAKEEIFGPVQSILKFETLDEVIDRANDTNYGLAAGIFTTNVQTALQFSNLVEAGIVWVNNYFTFEPRIPFGGFKDSGLGRENGLEGIQQYLETKTVNIAVPKLT